MMQIGTTVLAQLLVLGMLASALHAEPVPGTDERVPVVLVLDGSGSMWGLLEGETKMDIARTVVRDLALTFGDRIALGVVAYGHRRRGDCSDIETLVLPGQGSTAQLLAAVDGVKPKGKTPLAAAIEQAARDLDYRNHRAVITVVSDGRETCGLDPCAVASRLKADGLDFTAHVVGFDMSEDEGRELRCIASATGGLFAGASSRAELVAALGQVLTRTALPAGPAKLVLSAAQGEYRQPILEGLHWKITPLDAQGAGNGAVIEIEDSSEALELAAGRYELRVVYRGTLIRREIELRAGEAWREHVLFGPGQLALRAVLAEGATPITAPILWSLHPVGVFGRVASEPIYQDTRATCLVRIEAGDYEVRARFGDAERRLRIELRAGVIQPVTLDLEAGEARIFASLPAPGGPIRDSVEWTIRPVDSAGEVGEPIIERSTTTETFILPVGRYHVTGRHGDRLGDGILRIEAGRSEAVGIVLRERAVPAAPGGR